MLILVLYWTHLNQCLTCIVVGFIKQTRSRSNSVLIPLSFYIQFLLCNYYKFPGHVLVLKRPQVCSPHSNYLQRNINNILEAFSVPHQYVIKATDQRKGHKTPEKIVTKNSYADWRKVEALKRRFYLCGSAARFQHSLLNGYETFTQPLLESVSPPTN